MVLITGQLRDSGNLPLSGILEVSLSETMIVPPSSVLTRRVFTSSVVNGVVNLNLESSEVQQQSYLFEFYTVDGTTRNYLLSFNAIIPATALEINFNSLLPTSITSDILDTSINRLADLITSNPVYSARVKAGFNGRGSFELNSLYYYNDVVTFDGSSHAFISKEPATGKPLSDALYWQLLASKGSTGSGTSGNNSAYGVSWLDALDAPSRGSLYSFINGNLVTTPQLAGLAPLASPAFTGTPTSTTPSSALNNSTRIATTAFVHTLLLPLISSPGASPTTATPALSSNNLSIANTEFLWQALSPVIDVLQPTVPRVSTASVADSTQRIANTAFVTGACATTLTTANSNSTAAINGLVRIASVSNNSLLMQSGLRFVWATWVSATNFAFLANTEHTFNVLLPEGITYSTIHTLQLTLRAGLAPTGVVILRGTSAVGSASFDLIVKHNVAFTGQMFISYLLAVS